ncbi:unnamed protein product [Rotaria socialis]|uniref:Endonuclease/exonuclease/phosphatase domain-containing protein n=1 Tax=Rotaria socialis TaxID=392032 RepID=A0A820VL28_9BILA|nr:unnamed protein product [Rotaria socialis]CAF4503345.1 unnamed protein product [Rotaria socialis]CAF4956885.1 unnamed protein product [Rotaria socialis]
MVKNSLNVKRVECILPNVCAVDVLTEETTRIVGVYASESRSWNWEQISPFITNNCVLFGDFNIDLEMDASKAETLLEWADLHSLAPFAPEAPTSRRSNRIIDFAFSNRASIDIQTYSGNTTSDHLPVLAVLLTKIKDKCKGKSVHWKVFNLVTEFTFPYWEVRWLLNDVDDTHNDYVQFLGLLIARSLGHRHTSSSISVNFWSKTKRFIKPSSSSLNALLTHTGEVVYDSSKMCEVAADYYEDFFRKSNTILRLHPYADAPWTDFDNKNDLIPEITLYELLQVVILRKKRNPVMRMD